MLGEIFVLAISAKLLYLDLRTETRKFTKDLTIIKRYQKLHP